MLACNTCLKGRDIGDTVFFPSPFLLTVLSSFHYDKGKPIKRVCKEFVYKMTNKFALRCIAVFQCTDGIVGILKWYDILVIAIHIAVIFSAEIFIN